MASVHFPGLQQQMHKAEGSRERLLVLLRGLLGVLADHRASLDAAIKSKNATEIQSAFSQFDNHVTKLTQSTGDLVDSVLGIGAAPPLAPPRLHEPLVPPASAPPATPVREVPLSAAGQAPASTIPEQPKVGDKASAPPASTPSK